MKIIFKTLGFISLISFLNSASQATQGHEGQSKAHQSGQSFASSLAGQAANAARSTNPHTVPGFQTDRPNEASLDQGSIGDAALSRSRTDEASQHLVSQAKDRQSFKVDPNTDPLLVGANQVIANPQKALNEEFTEIQGSETGSEEVKTCEESGDEYLQMCSKRLEIVLQITPEKGYTTQKWCIGHWKSAWRGTKWYCGGCRGGDYVITQAKKVDVIREEWIDGCAILEDLVEKSLCRYESVTHSPKNETRTIQGEPIIRDHFEEHYTYACFKASPNNSCAGLREKGCYQVKSVCKERVGDVCVLWQQTYRCETRKQSSKTWGSTNRDNPSQTSLFCLTGNCADTSYKDNDEMMAVMSQLSVLREAQNDDLRHSSAIFKGNDRRCTRNCLSFRDCCGSGKGWGVSLHLANCDADERELRQLRDKNRCIEVGTYCAERDPIFNICLRKKTTFCCFGTKMARLIQHSGRAQLGIGFGNPESPNCNGLSADQLSRIDFSTINFSELFDEIRSQTVAKGQGESLAKISADRLKDNMTAITKPSLNHEATNKIREGGF